MDELKSKIREIPDFPKPGILFYDVTTLLKDPAGLRSVIDLLSDRYRGQGIDSVFGVEARGFILGPALAYQINAGFVPIRKQGKLPAETLSASYSLEYGEDTLEVHKDAAGPGNRVLIVDDLIATGGTASATANLVKGLGAEIVGLAFLVELLALKGREKLNGYDVFSVLQY